MYCWYFVISFRGENGAIGYDCQKAVAMLLFNCFIRRPYGDVPQCWDKIPHQLGLFKAHRVTCQLSTMRCCLQSNSPIDKLLNKQNSPEGSVKLYYLLSRLVSPVTFKWKLCNIGKADAETKLLRRPIHNPPQRQGDKHWIIESSLHVNITTFLC